MTTQRRCHAYRGGFVPPYLLTAMLLLASGCQTPPAKPSGCTPRTANADRYRVLARQVLCDTGEEFAHHPLRAGRTVLADQTAWFCAAGRGIFCKRIGMRLHGTPPPLCPVPDTLDPSLMETNLEPASVRLYPDGGEALALLEHLIDSAQCRIDVIIFTWEDDEVGWQVARRLAAAASPTRRVRLLVDGSANLMFAPAVSPNLPVPQGSNAKTAGKLNRVVCWMAQQPHVELIRDRSPLAHFDHRKLVLIDGHTAWAGGRNFTEAAFFQRHDISYTVQGPLVGEWQSMFENYWRQQGGKPACIQTEPLPIIANAAGRLVGNSPTHHSLRKSLYRAIDAAKHSILLENPYLTDNGVITKLARARRRGVDARILFTIQSDTESINHTNKVTANRLLAAGVRVYLYPGRIHTKTALIDGSWAYMGSGNFDLLSLYRNHELGIVFGPGPIIQDLEQTLFIPDFNPEYELHAPLPLTCEDYAYELLAGMFL